MRRTHSNTRILIAAISLVGASTVPAFAAEPASAPRSDGGLEVLDAVRKEAPRVAEAAAARQREREHGPFVPIVGAVDYGSADAAFGAARSGHAHEGQDMFAASGTPLVSVTDTVVADAGSDGGQGNYVHLYDPQRKRTYVYMHMAEPAMVATGERVEAGERVGAVGCTGSCWGEHLHFEIRAGEGMTGPAQDPLPLLQSWHRANR